MNDFWFKPKKYGYGIGWPMHPKGWAVFVVFLCALLAAFYVDMPILERRAATLKEILRFLLDIGFLTGLFLLSCKDKVEGGLKWRWGDKE